MSWCGLNFKAIQDKGQIVKLNDSHSEEVVYKMESEIDEYPFFQGGILMTNKNSQFLLMDAFSHKVYTSNDPDFKYD